MTAMPVAGHGVSQQSGFVVERVFLAQTHDHGDVGELTGGEVGRQRRRRSHVVVTDLHLRPGGRSIVVAGADHRIEAVNEVGQDQARGDMADRGQAAGFAHDVRAGATQARLQESLQRRPGIDTADKDLAYKLYGPADVDVFSGQRHRRITHFRHECQCGQDHRHFRSGGGENPAVSLGDEGGWTGFLASHLRAPSAAPGAAWAGLGPCLNDLLDGAGEVDVSCELR